MKTKTNFTMKHDLTYFIIKSNLLLAFSSLLFSNSYTQSVERFYYNGSNQFNGTVQTWTVPGCVSTATVELWGAGGSQGYYYGSCGGSGAYVKGTISVKQGQVIYVVVGAGGLYLEENTSEIYGGGGWEYYGGCGGGRAAIQFVSGTDIATAAGGGGGGNGDDYYYSFYYGMGGAGGYGYTSSIAVQGKQNNGWSSGECTSDFGYGATCTSGGTGALGECGVYSTYGGFNGTQYTGASSGYSYYGGGGGGESYPCTSNANFTIITGASGSTVTNTHYQNTRLPPAGTSSPNYNIVNPSVNPIGTSISAFEANPGYPGYGGNGEVTITFANDNLTISATPQLIIKGDSTLLTASCSDSAAKYMWTPSVSVTKPTSASTYAHPATTTVYTVKVTASCGTLTDTITVYVGSCSFNSSITVNSNAGCNGKSNGSTTANATGGTSPYTFLWSNGQTGAKATGLTAGIISVSLTDSKGCTSSATVSIPSSILSVTTQITQGNYCTNSGSYITATPANGQSPYTYLWSNKATTSTITGLSAGTYTLTVTDNNGCSISTTDVITNHSSKIQISYTVSPLSCYGGSNGAITANAADGTAPYTYVWSPSGETGATATGLTSGIYTVLVTDANGCTNIVAVNLNEPSKLTVTIAADVNVLCYGASTGTARAVAAGGTSPYYYLWNNGNTNDEAQDLTAGSYTVIATDGHGCTASVSTTLTQPTALYDSVLSISNIKCYKASGCINLIPYGGTAPYTYKWSNGATTSEACNLSAGTYKPLITDAHGCTLTVSATLTQPAALSITMSITNVSCNGNKNGSITASVAGGTSPYLYLWSNGSTASVAGGMAPGSYTVSVTDINSCTLSASAVITQPALLRDSIVSQSCSNGKGDATAGAVGGTGPYNYVWNPGSSTGVSVTGLSNGTFTVTVTDKNSCTATVKVSISCPPEEIFGQQNSGNDLCCPDNSDAHIMLFPNPNRGQFTLMENGEWTTDIKQGTIDNGQWTMDNERRIVIYNILGEKVYSKQYSIVNYPLLIDLSACPEGMYFIQVIAGEAMQTGKVIISR